MLSYGDSDGLGPYQRFMRRSSVRGVAAVIMFYIGLLFFADRVLR